MALVIPEVILVNIVDALLEHVKHDFEDNTLTPEKSLLYRYFNGIVNGKRNYYTEAVSLFTRDVDHPRRIETRMAFDAERSKIPTIHITIPSDQPGQNTLGVGESDSFSDDGVDYSVDYERRFDCQYQVVCTSDNHEEVMLMTNLLKAGLISIFDTLSLSGLENARISTQELKANPDLVPNHIFMRAVGVAFSYDMKVPRWWSEKLITQLTIGQGKPYDNE